MVLIVVWHLKEWSTYCLFPNYNKWQSLSLIYNISAITSDWLKIVQYLAYCLFALKKKKNNNNNQYQKKYERRNEKLLIKSKLVISYVYKECLYVNAFIHI